MNLTARHVGPLRRFAAGLVFALAWAIAAIKLERRNHPR